MISFIYHRLPQVGSPFQFPAQRIKRLQGRYGQMCILVLTVCPIKDLQFIQDGHEGLHNHLLKH